MKKCANCGAILLTAEETYDDGHTILCARCIERRKKMYRCAECGFEFDTPFVWTEDRGEWFGFPAEETMSGCPMCRGGYDEINEEDEEYDDE